MRKYKIRLNKLSDCRRFLARVINDLDSDQINESKARALTYSASILSQVIEKSDLENRVESLERALKIQGGAMR